MIEERIQLPDFLIADLYKASLVDLKTSNVGIDFHQVQEKPIEASQQIEAKHKISFLGENKKGVIIIVCQPDAVFVKEDELVFLTNILKACQLSLADISIINNMKQEIDYDALQQQLGAKTILLFDVEPSAIKLPFIIPAFQVQKFSGSTIMDEP
jgi:hypothetical protein